MVIKYYEMFDGIDIDKLTLKDRRFCVIANSKIKSLELINCQDCLVSGNTLGTLKIDNRVPEFEGWFKKRKRKRFIKRFGSQRNYITFNIELGEAF